MHIRKQSEKLFSKIIDFIYLNQFPCPLVESLLA
jgi:hypothetical protein